MDKSGYSTGEVRQPTYKCPACELENTFSQWRHCRDDKVPKFDPAQNKEIHVLSKSWWECKKHNDVILIEDHSDHPFDSVVKILIGKKRKQKKMSRTKLRNMGAT